MNKKPILFITGPTASGKSKLALRLAKRIKGEIILCDSMQIYKGLNILSAKPSQVDRKLVKHHLIDIVNPSQSFNVNRFINLSKRIISEIHNRDKTPIFVGGTGLYIDSLLNGIFQGPAKDSKIRSNLYKKAKDFSSNYLHKRLKKIDPQSAKKIHPNDLRRIVRALEVYQITKIPISRLQKRRKGILQDKQYNIRIFGLNMPREKLYENINRRVDRMFKLGVVTEVKNTLRKRCSRTFKQALGIKEINAYLKGKLDLNRAKELIKQNTRRYAKRQLTWFNKGKKIIWLDNTVSDNMISKIIK